MSRLQLPKLTDSQWFWVELIGWELALAVGVLGVLVLSAYYKAPSSL